LDVYQTPDEVVVKATLPGLKPEDVSIDITGETLTIKGETKAEQEIKKEDYLYHKAVWLFFPQRGSSQWA
jgi:HSP20 family protein